MPEKGQDGSMVTVERHKRLSDRERDKLATALSKEYAQGRSLAELAEARGTSAGRVRGLLLAAGVTLRSRGGDNRKPDPQRKQLTKTVAAAYAKGATLGELAAQHGVSAATARNLVLEGGGTMRARGGSRRRGGS